MSMNPLNEVAIYNPDSQDFTVNYGGKPYTIGTKEGLKFPKEIANHIAKHLAKHLVFKRGIKRNFDADYKEVLKEIYI